MEQQHNFCQIGPLNLWCIPLRSIQVAALGPEAMTGSRRSPASAAFTLVSRCAADVFDEQSTDAALGVVAGNSRLAAIDHVPNAIDDDRRLGHIRSTDYLAEVVCQEREVLFSRMKIAMVRNQAGPLSAADS